MILNSKQMMTEEEAVVRSLRNELSTAQSYLNIENTKNRNLQSRMDDDRFRYEQRLSMLSSHSIPRESHESSINVANKVETLRLRQELDEALKTITQHQEGIVAVASPKPPVAQELSDLMMEESIQNEQLEKAVCEPREKNESMEEESSYQWYRGQIKDTISERDRLQSAVYRLEGEVRDEEKEAQKRSDDVDSLRNDRNEWRYWYDEAMTWNQ